MGFNSGFKGLIQQPANTRNVIQFTKNIKLQHVLVLDAFVSWRMNCHNTHGMGNTKLRFC